MTRILVMKRVIAFIWLYYTVFRTSEFDTYHTTRPTVGIAPTLSTVGLRFKVVGWLAVFWDQVAVDEMFNHRLIVPIPDFRLSPVFRN